MENINLVNLALVPVVVSVVSAFKSMGYPTKYAPLLAIVVGILGVVVFSGFSGVSIVIGVVTGLASAGFYSGIRTTLNK